MRGADHGRGTVPLLQQGVEGALDGEVLVLHRVGDFANTSYLQINGLKVRGAFSNLLDRRAGWKIWGKNRLGLDSRG